METAPDWRSPRFAQQLGHLDRGALSFEFLRRNREYRADYADTLQRIALGEGVKVAAVTRFAQRWGLAFPSGPEQAGGARKTALASFDLPCNGHCLPCPGWLRRRRDP